MSATPQTQPAASAAVQVKNARELPGEVPHSAYAEVNGLVYFARMLSKIRLFAVGNLREDFHKNLGKGADGWMCGYLHVAYEDIKQQVLNGASDDEVMAWCLANGRPLNETDKLVWNNFAAKLGWNDFVTPMLEGLKQEWGFADREEIQTMPEFFEYDEGRKA